MFIGAETQIWLSALLPALHRTSPFSFFLPYEDGVLMFIVVIILVTETRKTSVIY